MKADCCISSHDLCLEQKVALENTTKTTTYGQLAWTFYACMRGNDSPYQQVAVVYICHCRQTVVMIKQSSHHSH